MEDKKNIRTRAVHTGEKERKIYTAITYPIVQASTYTFRNTQELKDYWAGKTKHVAEYGRYGNPTTRAVEEKIASLEGGASALLFSSGMNAITTTLFAMLKPGAHIIITDDSYRKTRQFAMEVLSKYNVEVSIAAPSIDSIEKNIKKNTRIIFSESPTNPYLNIIDMQGLACLAKKNRIKTIIDSTLATPFNQRPLEQGIDLVIHSATKYLGGHNDLLAGVLIGKSPIISAVKDFQGIVGGVSDPNTSYLLLRGLKTLPVRIENQNKSGLRIAEYLENHPCVLRVYYPGLKSHPQYEIAKKQMTGFGGLISFEIKGDLDDGSRFIDGLKIPYIAPSLGGVESLIEQPALMSYYELTTEERLAVGIKDNLIRLSVGLEDTEDLIADIEQSFKTYRRLKEREKKKI